MKRGQPSQTAAAVAFGRALAHAGGTSVRGFFDPTARPLLSATWLSRLEKLERRAARRGRWLQILRTMGDMMALRTLAIDAQVQAAVARGARQLVILGAGLDGRAFRMRELADVDVFEVDHPDTQAAKRERAAALTSVARTHRYVAVDFARDALDGALAAAGHRRTEPTVWLWEGVVMYLADAALRATLAAIAARSAAGSTLLAQYHTPVGRSLLGRLQLWIWGEPQIGLRTPEQMAAGLAAAGLPVVDDSGMADWAAAHGVAMPRTVSARRSRLAVAVRRG